MDKLVSKLFESFGRENAKNYTDEVCRKVKAVRVRYKLGGLEAWSFAIKLCAGEGKVSKEFAQLLLENLNEDTIYTLLALHRTKPENLDIWET
jgi:hypothetical protein